MDRFYDRVRELEALENRWNADGAQFALLYGRRRVGKTYLLQHFFVNRPHCYFLASQTSLADNIASLAESVLQAMPNSGYTVSDLGTLNAILRFVGNHARERRFALVLDEFQYLLEGDPSIASQIQAWWDSDGIRSNVFLVLCGSHLGVMEGLGGPQAPLFGRFTFRYKLPPMGYQDIALFYENSKYSTRDKFTAYGVLGGTPRYHALFDPKSSLQKNICEHILDPLGLLHNEPEVLMLSSQVRDPSPYNATLRAIATGCTRFNEIALRVGTSSPQLSFYLKGLAELEWVRREYPFDETSDKRAIYRIADNFLLFWYRFVAGLKSQLEVNNPRLIFDSSIQPHMDDYMGRFVWEGICRDYLRANSIERVGQSVKDAARWWSRDGRIEIDLMAELGDGRYLLGECKWSSSPVGIGVYYDLREKVAQLPSAKYRDNPVYALFSLAGFDDNLRERAKREEVVLMGGEEIL